MVPDKPEQILMCVSPGDDFEAALDYAVAEAVRRRRGIHLALVVRPLVVGSPDVPSLSLLEAQRRKRGTDFLTECQRRVTKAVGPGVDVSTEIAYGPVVPALVEVSQDTAIAVMQHLRNRAHHVPTLSVTNGVAARGHAPVVAVPDAWREQTEDCTVVVVGVEDAISSASVAQWAFEEAQRLGGSVRLVRAWFFSAAFDGDVFAGQAGLVQTAYVREELGQEFAELVGRFPDVPSEVVAVHGPAADVLVGQSRLRDVRRVVVGRHDPIFPLGSHLGPVTHAVLNHSASPVVVVDPRGTCRTSSAQDLVESTTGSAGR